MFNKEDLQQRIGQLIRLKQMSSVVGLAVFLLALFGLGLPSAQAYTIVEKSTVNLHPNEVKNVFVSIKNQTSYAWEGGSGKTAFYLYGNSSPLYYGTWKKADLPAYINEKTVAPGKLATASFYVKAPSTPGTYTERFLLGDGTSWHKNTVIEISFKVGGATYTAPVTVNTSNSNSGETQSDAGTAISNAVKDYLARMLLKPAGPFITSGNGTLTISLGMQNIGTTDWKNQTVKLKGVSPDLGDRYSGVRHDSWESGTKVETVSNTTAPGTLSLLSFKIKAPAKKGEYKVKFALLANGEEIPGGLIEIPITVTADGYIEPEPAATSNTNNQTAGYTPPSDPANLPNEPIIRVGLYKTTDDILMVRGVNGGFGLMQGSTSVCTFNAGEVAKVFYDRVNGVYKATGPRCQTQSTQYYVAVAPDGISPLEITDFSRPVSWLPGANDNKFRGKLELRFTPKTDAVWVINELPMEWYLKGIAETSDVSPMEFQKTLLVAARTYAMYHVTRATKHADEYFIVDAKYDQVYRGYGQEARSPRIVAAIDETRGIIVTHQGKIAITPYFSRSDGRTRSWSEVWYGEVEWCVGVPVPQDAGKTLWGHGVGMSASGALAMAAHEDRTYDYILKYFYKGIELKKWYK